MTELTATDICKMTAAITGSEMKRAATKKAAIARLRKVAVENGLDAEAILSGADDQPEPEVAPVVAGKSRRAALALIEAETPAPAIKEKKARASRASGQPRTGTKQDVMIGMLRAPEGATIAAIMDATGWQAHTVRGAFAGALKKKLGLLVTSEKVDGRGRVYRIA